MSEPQLSYDLELIGNINVITAVENGTVSSQN
jgi:hypothetical protein